MRSVEIRSNVDPSPSLSPSLPLLLVLGGLKPWHHAFDEFTGKVQPIDNSYHVTTFLQLWWNIYRTELYPHLSHQQQEVCLSTLCLTGSQLRFSVIRLLTPPSPVFLTHSPSTVLPPPIPLTLLLLLAPPLLGPPTRA